MRDVTSHWLANLTWQRYIFVKNYILSYLELNQRLCTVSSRSDHLIESKDFVICEEGLDLQPKMGLTISNLFNQLFGKKQMRILMGELIYLKSDSCKITWWKHIYILDFTSPLISTKVYIICLSDYLIFYMVIAWEQRSHIYHFNTPTWAENDSMNDMAWTPGMHDLSPYLSVVKISLYFLWTNNHIP